MAAAKGYSWQVIGWHEDFFIFHACGTRDTDEAAVSFSTVI